MDAEGAASRNLVDADTDTDGDVSLSLSLFLGDPFSSMAGSGIKIFSVGMCHHGVKRVANGARAAGRGRDLFLWFSSLRFDWTIIDVTDVSFASTCPNQMTVTLRLKHIFYTLMNTF